MSIGGSKAGKSTVAHSISQGPVATGSSRKLYAWELQKDVQNTPRSSSKAGKSTEVPTNSLMPTASLAPAGVRAAKAGKSASMSIGGSKAGKSTVAPSTSQGPVATSFGEPEPEAEPRKLISGDLEW